MDDLLIEVEIPMDIRIQMPARFTRVWKLKRRADCRIMWDTKIQDLTVYNPGNVEFTDDEWLSLLTLGSALKRGDDAPEAK